MIFTACFCQAIDGNFFVVIKIIYKLLHINPTLYSFPLMNLSRSGLTGHCFDKFISLCFSTFADG